MSLRWTEGHAKTVMSRLRTHVFPLIGQRPIAELDTHDLLEVTLRIKERGTMDVALRVQNYLSTIMRGAADQPESGARSGRVDSCPAYRAPPCPLTQPPP